MLQRGGGYDLVGLFVKTPPLRPEQFRLITTPDPVRSSHKPTNLMGNLLLWHHNLTDSILKLSFERVTAIENQVDPSKPDAVAFCTHVLIQIS